MDNKNISINRLTIMRDNIDRFKEFNHKNLNKEKHQIIIEKLEFAYQSLRDALLRSANDAQFKKRN